MTTGCGSVNNSNYHSNMHGISVQYHLYGIYIHIVPGGCVRCTHILYLVVV